MDLNSLSLVFALLVAASTIILVVLQIRPISSLKGLPGPSSPSLLVGHELDVGKARVGTRFNVFAREYGPTYRLRGPLLEPILILGDPKGASHVLTANALNYPRPSLDRVVLRQWFGNGLFCAEGDEHKRQRRMLNPAFSSQSIKDISHVFFELSLRLREKWVSTLDGRPSAVFDIASTLHTFSMDAITMTMFMYDCSASEGTIPDLLHKINNAPGTGDDASTLGTLVEALLSKFPSLLTMLPTPMKTWADNLRTRLGAIAEDVWRGKVDAMMDAKLLDLLDKHASPSSGSITKDEVIAQMIGILFAGSETVANVISELFHELALQPRIQTKLRNEILDFETRMGRMPDFDDLSNPTILPYLEAVARETLRVKAVLMYISRVAAHDDVIPLLYPLPQSNVREVHVRAGQEIRIPVRDGINTDPTIWGEDPRVFRPERWMEPGGLPESVLAIHAQGNTLGFGDGPKVCLGRIFALTELKIVVTTMLRHFEVQDAGVVLDFYHLGGNTVKPKVRGREEEGVQMPVRVKELAIGTGR